MFIKCQLKNMKNEEKMLKLVKNVHEVSIKEYENEEKMLKE